jgi:hypothetical protein
MPAAPLAARFLGFFLVESLNVIVSSISNLLKGVCLAKHGLLSMFVDIAVFFFRGEKKYMKSAWGSR